MQKKLFNELRKKFFCSGALLPVHQHPYYRRKLNFKNGILNSQSSTLKVQFQYLYFQD